jgi:hypothetical protein
MSYWLQIEDPLPKQLQTESGTERINMHTRNKWAVVIILIMFWTISENILSNSSIMAKSDPIRKTCSDPNLIWPDSIFQKIKLIRIRPDSARDDLKPETTRD